MKTRKSEPVQGEGDYEAARRSRSRADDAQDAIAAERQKPVAPAGAGHPPAGAFVVNRYAFLENKACSPETLQVHLGLYKGYVEQANQIVAAIGELARGQILSAAVHARESLARRLAFEANGVQLHEWFFEQLGGGSVAAAPASESVAMEAMDECFGGFDAWVADVKALAQTRGSGWVLALWDERRRSLSNGWIDLHHLGVQAGQKVIFALDLWEHAYWNDYGPKGRAQYVERVLGDTNWRVVEQRFLTKS